MSSIYNLLEIRAIAKQMLHIILFLMTNVLALNNGLGRTPAMGWNSWNLYGCDVNEEIVKRMADSIVENGLDALGYIYVTVDDCWQTGRGVDGKIKIDTDRFPLGMKALGDYIHSKGLKFGIYSSAGVCFYHDWIYSHYIS